MSATVREQSPGQWYAYGRTRVLGPYPSERAAWRALRQEGEE